VRGTEGVGQGLHGPPVCLSEWRMPLRGSAVKALPYRSLLKEPCECQLDNN